MIKLYVDDLRKCPEGWTLARNNTEAIRLLSTGYVEAVSVDHDICVPFSGELSASVKRRLEIGKETFQPVAFYLSVMPEAMRPKVIKFHTANVEAGKNMVALLRNAGIESTYEPCSYNIEML